MCSYGRTSSVNALKGIKLLGLVAPGTKTFPPEFTTGTSSSSSSETSAAAWQPLQEEESKQSLDMPTYQQLVQMFQLCLQAFRVDLERVLVLLIRLDSRLD